MSKPMKRSARTAAGLYAAGLYAAAVVAGGLVLPAGEARAELEPAWETGGVNGPESVVVDRDAGVLYLSNVNGGAVEANGKGYIAKLSPDGKILEKEWVGGLNAPKGLGLHDGKLYVADITEIAVIDTKTGKVVKTHQPPRTSFLNDVTVHKDGRVFVSDMLENQIWLLEDGKLSLWLESDALDNPNGLHAEDDRLVVATWGKPKEDFSTDVPGTLKAVTLETKAVKALGEKPVGNLDGLQPDGKGGYWATDWFNGGLYRFAPDGSAELVMDLDKGSADLVVSEDGTLAIIPMMLDDKVSAYRLP